MHPLSLLLGSAAALAAYPFLEARWYRLTRLRVPIGRTISPIDILHISDTHMSASDAGLRRFLRGLNERVGHVPDLVVATGDLVEGDEGIDPLVSCLGELFPTAARFYVLGSHDYYNPRFQSYAKYFATRGRGKIRAPLADTRRLEDGLQAAGWRSVQNTETAVEVRDVRVRIGGVDDPYLNRHRTDHIARAPGDVLAVGLVHAPDVVSDWILAGFDLVLAGHTHAGQVRIPGVGAVVTNSSLPASLGGGLHRIGAGWLHVSPGLGTGRFAPIRFACRPEATLLSLTR
ncbi:MAG: metallophosphoesterase [Actinomycetota bacterium]|nr:metallophosphoesterase [Actinomycetota bacterium]